MKIKICRGVCMYELIQLTEHDYYIDCPAKIGLVRIDEDNVVLIDSGNDKDAGKKVFRILEANGWNLKAIFNTHSHADHIGGNRFLQDKTGCSIYAKGMECTYTNHPILEPTTLYGGLPFKALKHKFLMAKDSKADFLTEYCLPEGMELLELPGHSFDMVGFKTCDGTAYIADCVSSRETLTKYGIGYLWNVEDSLATLAFINVVNDHIDTVRSQVEDAAAPDHLARRAGELGMVPAGVPGVIDLTDSSLSGGRAADGK